jgi:hypothetical protein
VANEIRNRWEVGAELFVESARDIGETVREKLRDGEEVGAKIEEGIHANTTPQSGFQRRNDRNGCA